MIDLEGFDRHCESQVLKEMTRLLLAMVCLAFLPELRAEGEHRLVASVKDIREANVSRLPGMRIEFVVHEPRDLAGVTFEIVAEQGSRKSARGEFPLGALFEVRMRSAALDELRKSKRDHERVQQQIDEGVRPDVISQLVVVPLIKRDDLVVEPRSVER